MRARHASEVHRALESCGAPPHPRSRPAKGASGAGVWTCEACAATAAAALPPRKDTPTGGVRHWAHNRRRGSLGVPRAYVLQSDAPQMRPQRQWAGGDPAHVD